MSVSSCGRMVVSWLSLTLLQAPALSYGRSVVCRYEGTAVLLHCRIRTRSKMRSDEQVDRIWIVHRALALYEAVLAYSGKVRGFCRLLDIRWPGDRFDQAYFAERMREARRRRKDLRERLRALIPPRTPVEGVWGDLEPHDLAVLHDVLQTCGASPFAKEAPGAEFTPRGFYDAELYRRRLMAALRAPVTAFQDLPPVLDHPRLDRVFRFVTLIFMAHHGQVVLEQPDPGTILVIRREAAREDALC